MKIKTLTSLALLCLCAGCMVGRTGKVGKPISVYYEKQLESVVVGKTTPDDLKRLFATNAAPVHLKDSSMEGSHKIETWELSKGGDIDVAELIIWGGVAYNKDQELLFHFTDDKLTSWESVVLPDPPQQYGSTSNKTPPMKP